MSSFRQNLIKGRVAEEIVSSLFFDMGFIVIRHGREYTSPGIQVLRDLRRVRRLDTLDTPSVPDFFIAHRNDNDQRATEFVEVKFRAHSKIKLENVAPYGGKHFLFLDRKSIWSASFEEIEERSENGWVQFSDLRRLEADHWFGLMPADKKFLRDNVPTVTRWFDGFFPQAYDDSTRQDRLSGSAQQQP